jgi:hypothetical protein
MGVWHLLCLAEAGASLFHSAASGISPASRRWGALPAAAASPGTNGDISPGALRVCAHGHPEWAALQLGPGLYSTATGLCN